MVVGLGTGSTAYFAVERVGQKISSGELRDVVCIPTSERTQEQAESLHIPLCTLDDITEPMDVAIDGADSVDADLNLVKGGGGAMHREKMIAQFAKKFIVIVDDSKLCHRMGPHFPLPVEITPFAHEHTVRCIAVLSAAQGCTPVVRRGDCSNNKEEPDGEASETDNRNFVVDLKFDEPIGDVSQLASQVKELVGVVDHGLFIKMATQVIVASGNGVRIAGEGAEKPWW